MSSRPQSAKSRSSGVASPNSPLIYKINSARRSIPTHRHLIKEAIKHQNLQNQRNEEQKSRAQSARHRHSVDLFKVTRISIGNDIEGQKDRQRPQSATALSRKQIFEDSSGKSHNDKELKSSSHESTTDKKRKMQIDSFGLKRASFQGFEVRRSSTSFSLLPESARSHSVEYDNASKRPHSATTRSPSRQFTPLFGGFGNVLRRSSGMKLSLEEPVSWTKSSRSKESLPMIELSLAENLKDLSTRTIVSKKELMENYVKVYDIAFERVLESLNTQEVHGILTRIRTAYQRIYTLFLTSQEEFNDSSLSESIINENSSNMNAINMIDKPNIADKEKNPTQFTAETINNYHEDSDSSNSGFTRSRSNSTQSDSSSSRYYDDLSKKIQEKYNIQEYNPPKAEKKPSVKRKKQNNKLYIEEIEKANQELKIENNILNSKVQKYASILEFYRKKYNEEDHNQDILQSKSNEQLLKLRMKQIELEVDSHVFNNASVDDEMLGLSPRDKKTPRKNQGFSPRSALSPRTHKLSPRGEHEPPSVNSSYSSNNSSPNPSPRIKFNHRSNNPNNSNNINEIFTSKDQVNLKEHNSRRSDAIRKEIELAKSKIFELEKELHSIENEDFFQNLGFQEGDKLNTEAHELSLKERALLQARESKNSSTTGVAISRGFKSNFNYGRLSPREEEQKSKSRQFQ